MNKVNPRFSGYFLASSFDWDKVQLPPNSGFIRNGGYHRTFYCEPRNDELVKRALAEAPYTRENAYISDEQVENVPEMRQSTNLVVRMLYFANHVARYLAKPIPTVGKLEFFPGLNR